MTQSIWGNLTPQHSTYPIIWMQTNIIGNTAQ
jgi:hypothetical protein